ncbi:MAG: hypothetical protein LBH22_00010 [Bacteroidales bacterium]|jgi:hypothetical protein|nr:hypothetical protein [Bacteroidales bacterium]
MKKLASILTICLLISNVYAENAAFSSIGFGCGYSSYNTFRGELYLRSDLKLFNRNSEVKAGINNHSYQLTFDNVPDLDASSIGLFGDIAIYPFDKGLFAGIRWEMLNINWLSRESRNKVENERGHRPIIYTGTSIFFQIGYDVKISNRFGLKLYAQPGFQQFRILSPPGNPNHVIENHFKFIYNVNLSLEIKL